jgi:hypothetical protein
LEGGTDLNPEEIVWTSFIVHLANDKLEMKKIYFNPRIGNYFLLGGWIGLFESNCGPESLTKNC